MSQLEAAPAGVNVEQAQEFRRTGRGFGEAPRWAGPVGVTVFGLIALVAIAAPIIAPYSATDAGVGLPLQPPSGGHPFGTDATGMDVLSRVMWAPRTDLLIAVLSTGLALLVGTVLGSVAGYASRTVSSSLARFSDLVQAFPLFILALLIISIAGRSMTALITVIAFLSAPLFFRLTRAEAERLRDVEFIQAARLSGVPHWRILVRHVIPNATGPALIQAPISAGWAMLLAAGLSFVGAGIQPPTPEWGLMVATGANDLATGEWWTALFPGLSLALTAISLSLIGVALERRRA